MLFICWSELTPEADEMSMGAKYLTVDAKNKDVLLWGESQGKNAGIKVDKERKLQRTSWSWNS